MSIDAADLTRRTLDILDQCGVPNDLAQTAFKRVFDLLVAQSIEVPSPATSRANHLTVTPGSSEAGDPPSGDHYDAVAKELKITADEATRIYDFHDGTLRFEGKAEKFGDTKSDIAAGVILMTIAGRIASGIDAAETSTSEVRQELERLGLLDVSNFSKHVARLKPFVSVYGSGKAAAYKLKYDGRIEAQRYAGLLLDKADKPE